MSTIQYIPITAQLCEPVAELLQICFPHLPKESIYAAHELEELADIYPEGTIVALDGERVVGMGAGIMVHLDFNEFPKTEHALLYDEQDVCRHDMQGQYYFGSELGVHPDYRGRGIARQIYNRRKAEVTKHNKKGFIAAAVLPGYTNFIHSLSAEAYVAKVVQGEFFDPTLSVQLRNGFEVIKLLKDFYVNPQTNNWSALIYWENDQYCA